MFNTLINEVLRLARENPDYVYPSGGGTCRYSSSGLVNGVPVDPDCKGCIFGQAFQNLGWELPGEGTYVGYSVGDEFSMEEKAFCNDLQAKQDSGTKWGDLVEIVENYLSTSEV